MDTLESLTFWEHELTFNPKGLLYFYTGLVIALGLIFFLYFFLKKSL